MSEQPRTSWAFDKPVDGNPFARPRGLAGRLAGLVMAMTNHGEQRQAAELLAIKPGERVIEIGYGPGQLVAHLVASGAGTVAGVDPSVEMQRMARRRVRAARAVVDLRVGTAAETGFPDGAFDAAVAVNNVAIWPDLEAALDEIQRVLRPGGRALIAWHGGRAPSLAARSMVLPAPVLDRIEASLNERFAAVTRHELEQLTAFLATR